MTANQNNNILTAFQSKRVWRLLKDTGIDRVSRESVDALNSLLTRRARGIATKAVEIADQDNREIVTEEDITRAVIMTSSIATFETQAEAPFVHYVWFISSGGTCLLSRSYSGLKFPDTIFSGLLTGILDLMSEVTGRMLEKLSTDNLTIHIRRIQPSAITVAVISDSDKSEPIDELTELLAMRFTEVFIDEIDKDVIDTSIFEEFEPVLDALVAGAGLKIPKETLKIIQKRTTLTEKQLEETVDATALREEMKRARELIQTLGVFSKGTDETVRQERVDSLLDESPDVTEIKAVLKQASQDLREADSDTSRSIVEEPSLEVTRKEVIQEIAKDFPEITLHAIMDEVRQREESKAISLSKTSTKKNKPIKVRKKTSKKKRKR